MGARSGRVQNQVRKEQGLGETWEEGSRKAQKRREGT
jgi:hypothetical protein